MELLDVLDCLLERRMLIRRKSPPSVREFLLGHGQFVESDAVEPFRVGAQRGVAVPADRVDYLESDGGNVGTRLLCRPGQRAVALSGGETIPVKDSHRSGQH